MSEQSEVTDEEALAQMIAVWDVLFPEASAMERSMRQREDERTLHWLRACDIKLVRA